MEVCLMVEGQEGETWQDWVALAQAAEESGLDGLFRSDHYLSMNDPGTAAMDAWAILAGLAGRTERIRLGTLVSPATFRHPSVLGNMVCTVDHISNGRAELGLGAGWYEAEHRAFGFQFPASATRFEILEEQAEIISRQWTEDDVSFSGLALHGRALLRGTQASAAAAADDHRRIRQAPDCRRRGTLRRRVQRERIQHAAMR